MLYVVRGNNLKLEHVREEYELLMSVVQTLFQTQLLSLTLHLAAGANYRR